MTDAAMADQLDEIAFWRRQAEKLVALFERTRGRRPETPEELNAWCATPAGKAALSDHLTPDGKIIPD